MKIKSIFFIVAVFITSFLFGCDFADPVMLVDPSDVPSTENGAISLDNRFFFVGGNSIYELIKQPDGSHDYEVIVQRDDCTFGGLTADATRLYAACTSEGSSLNMMGMEFPFPGWSELVRVDLQRDESDPNRVASALLAEDNMFPNGMAVDSRGDIYITNTYSNIFQLLNLFPPEVIPAIVRVRITDDDPFTIQKKTVLSALAGGMQPNGIQIRGDRLWFVSMNVLHEAEIYYYGLRYMREVYSTSMTRLFDDFAVLPDNILAIAEDPTVNTLIAALLPDLVLPSPNPSQLTFVSTGPSPVSWRAGQVIDELSFYPDLLPSSATYIEDDEGPALYVTSFFRGGLYRIGLE